MTPAEFEYLARLLKERSGLIVAGDKTYLLESRLLPVARANGLDDLSALVARLQSNRDEGLKDQVTEAMTTNESFFFRDKTPFDTFNSTVLPHLLKTRSGQKSFRIWCAAASTGQEPYSLGMCLKEAKTSLAGWRHEIIGTDLSADVLRRAKLGRYSQFEVQRGLPIQLLVKYFTQTGNDWEISQDIRSMVNYKKFNLLDDFKSLGTFDVVFCRNVLIYFDPPTKRSILDRIAKQMSKDGFLFLGAAETVIGVTDSFKPIKGQRGLYVPAEATDADLKASGVAVA